MDLPFWGFHTVRPLRAYPNWRVNKHHVISHFMTCCNLVIKIWTVSTLLFELFQHKSLFIRVTSCENTESVISPSPPCILAPISKWIVLPSIKLFPRPKTQTRYFDICTHLFCTSVLPPQLIPHTFSYLISFFCAPHHCSLTLSCHALPLHPLQKYH